jgi:hypothetical protein
MLMRRLGCSRATIAANVLSEILLLAAASVVLTGALSWGAMLWLGSLL